MSHWIAIGLLAAFSLWMFVDGRAGSRALLARVDAHGQRLVVLEARKQPAARVVALPAAPASAPVTESANSFTEALARQLREQQAPPNGAATHEAVDTEHDRSATLPRELAPLPTDRPTPEDLHAGQDERLTTIDDPHPLIRAWSGAMTQLSMGILPPPLIDPVRLRFEQLSSESRAAGLPIDHCYQGTECWRIADSGPLCTCSCDGCRRAEDLYDQARRDVVGAPPKSGTVAWRRS